MRIKSKSKIKMSSLASKYVREASKVESNKHDDELGILKQLIQNKEKYDLTMEDIESIMVDIIMAGVDTVCPLKSV